MKSTASRAAFVAAAIVSFAAVIYGGAASGAGAALPPQAGTDAAALYAKHCATCHGKDGRAKTFKAKFNKARDLTDAAWQAGAGDERLFNSITQGRGKMPAFKKKLSPAQVESLVAHVRGLGK